MKKEKEDANIIEVEDKNAMTIKNNEETEFFRKYVKTELLSDVDLEVVDSRDARVIA